MVRQWHGLRVVGIAVCLILAACGGATASGQPAATEGQPAADPSEAQSSEAATEFRGTNSFSFPFSDNAVTDAPLRKALTNLNEQGWDIEMPVLGEPDLLMEGLVRGDFAFNAEATLRGLTAAQADFPIKLIFEYYKNPWAMYGVADIQECADLDGRVHGIHSESSSGLQMVNAYIANECPGTETSRVIIPGSANRAAALLAGEIEVTELDPADIIAVESEADEGQFHRIVNFVDTLPDLHPYLVYTTEEFLEENPDTVKAIIAETAEVYQQIEDDPEYLREIIVELVPGHDPATLDEVVRQFTELEIFPANLQLSEESVQATIDFNVEAGALEPGLTVDDVVDLTLLHEVVGAPD